MKKAKVFNKSLIVGFRGYTPLVAAGLNTSVNPTSGRSGFWGMKPSFITCLRVDPRAWCAPIAEGWNPGRSQDSTVHLFVAAALKRSQTNSLKSNKPSCRAESAKTQAGR